MSSDLDRVKKLIHRISNGEVQPEFPKRITDLVDKEFREVERAEAQAAIDLPKWVHAIERAAKKGDRELVISGDAGFSILGLITGQGTVSQYEPRIDKWFLNDKFQERNQHHAEICGNAYAEALKDLLGSPFCVLHFSGYRDDGPLYVDTSSSWISARLKVWWP